MLCALSPNAVQGCYACFLSITDCSYYFFCRLSVVCPPSHQLQHFTSHLCLVMPSSDLFPLSNCIDLSAHHFQTLLPHERAVLPHLAIGPGSGSSPKPSPSKGTCTRQQFHLRHTDQGWTEVDKETADKVKQTPNREEIATDAMKGQDAPSTLPKPADQLSEEHPAAAKVEQPQTDDSLKTSPQAKWQAYADPNGESPAAYKVVPCS